MASAAAVPPSPPPIAASSGAAGVISEQQQAPSASARGREVESAASSAVWSTVATAGQAVAAAPSPLLHWQQQHPEQRLAPAASSVESTGLVTGMGSWQLHPAAAAAQAALLATSRPAAALAAARPSIEHGDSSVVRGASPAPEGSRSLSAAVCAPPARDAKQRLPNRGLVRDLGVTCGFGADNFKPDTGGVDVPTASLTGQSPLHGRGSLSGSPMIHHDDTHSAFQVTRPCQSAALMPVVPVTVATGTVTTRRAGQTAADSDSESEHRVPLAIPQALSLVA